MHSALPAPPHPIPLLVLVMGLYDDTFRLFEKNDDFQYCYDCAVVIS